MTRPTELSETFLNAIYGDSESVRNDAWKNLYPVLRRFALRVLQRYQISPEDRDDFVQDAIEHVRHKAAEFDTNRDFEPWLWTVFQNYMRDLFRKKNREQHKLHLFAGGMGEMLDMNDTRPSPDPDHSEPMSEREINEIARWPLRMRLCAICLMGQWSRVPETILEGWVNEEGLSMPFPPLEFVNFDRNQRIEALAIMFGVNPNTILQWMIRLLKRLHIED